LYCNAQAEMNRPGLGSEKNERHGSASGSSHHTGLDAVSSRTVAGVLREALFAHEKLPIQELAIESDPPAVDLAVIQALAGE
jgi:hypothetical protein